MPFVSVTEFLTCHNLITNLSIIALIQTVMTKLVLNIVFIKRTFVFDRTTTKHRFEMTQNTKNVIKFSCNN